MKFHLSSFVILCVIAFSGDAMACPQWEHPFHWKGGYYALAGDGPFAIPGTGDTASLMVAGNGACPANSDGYLMISKADGGSILKPVPPARAEGCRLGVTGP